MRMHFKVDALVEDPGVSS